MGQIKNLHLIEDLQEKDLSMMEYAAVEHMRHSSIVFKIVEYHPKKVIIQVAQGKNAAGIYQNAKRLIEIVNETFSRFFEGKKLIANAIPFKESPANIVDSKWINKKMLETSTRLKDIAEDTGLDKTNLSSLISDSRPLSQQMKALFYFYFLSKSKLA